MPDDFGLRTSHRGPEQQSLFEPPKVCPSCRTTRVNLCRHDADVRHMAIETGAARPKGCLNSAQNRDGIPY